MLFSHASKIYWINSRGGTLKNFLKIGKIENIKKI